MSQQEFPIQPAAKTEEETRPESVTKHIESAEAHQAWERIKPHLTEVSGLESVSGEEGKVRDYLEAEAKKLGIETKTDEIGNLWLLSDAPEREILLCAHMDKVGEPAKMKEEGDTVVGRLDDALGVSVIMGLLAQGHRPSVLFTVDEEIGAQGAGYATDAISNFKERRPKLALILEVSALEKKGVGPLVYTSSAGRPFLKAPLLAIDTIVKENGLRAKLLRGMMNDSAAFATLPDQAVATLQVHVDRMHTPKEVALISDIKETALVLETIIQNHKRLPDVPLSTLSPIY